MSEIDPSRIRLTNDIAKYIPKAAAFVSEKRFTPLSPSSIPTPQLVISPETVAALYKKSGLIIPGSDIFGGTIQELHLHPSAAFPQIPTNDSPDQLPHELRSVQETQQALQVNEALKFMAMCAIGQTPELIPYTTEIATLAIILATKHNQ